MLSLGVALCLRILEVENDRLFGIGASRAAELGDGVRDHAVRIMRTMK